MALPAYADKWTDITGKYSVEADFVVLESGTVTLKKQGGKAVRVPLGKLCADDQRRAQDLHNQLCADGTPGESLSKWTDISGKYSTEAAFLSIENGNVRLRKKDGIKIILPIEKLSATDQQRAIELGKCADVIATSTSIAQKPATTATELTNDSVPAKDATITADERVVQDETVVPTYEKGKSDQKQLLLGTPNVGALIVNLGANWNASDVKQIGHWIWNKFVLTGDSTFWARAPSDGSPREAQVANAIAESSKDSPPRELLYGVLKPLIDATDSDVKVPANFMYVRFSKPFLEKHFCTQIDRTMPVRDTVLGASVSGHLADDCRFETGIDQK